MHEDSVVWDYILLIWVERGQTAVRMRETGIKNNMELQQRCFLELIGATYSIQRENFPTSGIIRS